MLTAGARHDRLFSGCERQTTMPSLDCTQNDIVSYSETEIASLTLGYLRL